MCKELAWLLGNCDDLKISMLPGQIASILKDGDDFVSPCLHIMR